jgi:hypothetical protein
MVRFAEVARERMWIKLQLSLPSLVSQAVHRDQHVSLSTERELVGYY